MAEKSDQPLTVNTPDAGAAFRFEMFLQNVVLGYWWVAATAIVIMLAAVAVYGFWDSSHASAQRTTSAETEDIVERVELALIDREGLERGIDTRTFQVVVVPGWNDFHAGRSLRIDIPLEAALEQSPKADADPEAVLTEAGDELMAVSGRGSGVAAAHAALLAAEMYRLAGVEDGQTKALEAAKAFDMPPVAFGADAALAQRAAAGGDLPGADALLRPWIREGRGFFGQQAAFDLGTLYEAADREGDAQAIYEELRQIWPASPLLDQVDARLDAMGVTAPTGEGAPIDAPADAPTGEGTPTDAPADAPAGGTEGGE